MKNNEEQRRRRKGAIAGVASGRDMKVKRGDVITDTRGYSGLFGTTRGSLHYKSMQFVVERDVSRRWLGDREKGSIYNLPTMDVRIILASTKYLPNVPKARYNSSLAYFYDKSGAFVFVRGSTGMKRFYKPIGTDSIVSLWKVLRKWHHL
jgi:hypothetical protein